MMQLLIPMTALPEHLAVTDPSWAPIQQMNLLPPGLILHDPSAVEKLVNGRSSLYLPEHLRAWLVPCLWWIAFLSVLFWVTFCMTSVFRRRWIEEEKLSFPVAQLPLAAAEAESGLFSQAATWVGFALPLCFASVNWLRHLFPALPQLSTQFNADMPQMDKPWSWLFPGEPIGFSPFQVGLMFLMPLNMSFSLWVFQVFWGLQMLIAGFYGLESGPWIGLHPYIPQQMFGAFLGLALLVVWNSRRHLREVLRKALGRTSRLDDSGDPLSARTAVFGGMAGLVLLLLCSLWAGLSLWLAVVVLAIFFLFSLLVSRLRAQLGLPVHDVGNPHYDLLGITGVEVAGPRNLGAMTSLFWFNGSFNASPVPYQMEGLKLAERTRSSPRILGLGLMVATVVGLVSSLWILLDVFYRNGAANMKGFNVFMWPVHYEVLSYWVNYGAPPHLTHGLAAGVGAASVFFLGALERRIPGWPLHPVAFAIAGDVRLRGYAVSAFLAWTTKVLVLRYGGVKLYRRALNLLLGMILGDITAHALSTLLSILLRVQVDCGIWGMQSYG
jgi:hypothetical protein